MRRRRVKYRVKLGWSCSDFVHHEHRFKWTASLCGQWQYTVREFRRRYYEWKFRDIDPDVCCCGREISKVRYFDSICAHGGCRSHKEYLVTCAMEGR